MQSMPEVIRATRKARGLTQSALATAACVGEATVRRIERGESPSLDCLASVAEALGLDIALVSRSGEVIHGPEADTASTTRGKAHADPTNTPAPAPDPTVGAVDGIKAGAATGG